jgi:uncharacterized RDD family membrane protein YckC
VVGRRVGAYLIDLAIAILITALLWIALTDRLDADTTTGGGFVIGETRYGFHEDSGGKRTAWALLSIATWLATTVVIPGLTGSSPGRALTKIRLVNRQGGKPGVGRAFLRFLLWVVDSLPAFNLVGFVTALSSKRNQRVGDMVAGTYTVKAEHAGRPIASIVPAPVGPGPSEHGYVAPPQPAAPPPGWYDDPRGEARLRWWDGGRWTDQTGG